MSELLQRVALRVLAGLGMPLIVGWLAYVVLSYLMAWPSTLAVLAGAGLAWLGIAGMLRGAWLHADAAAVAQSAKAFGFSSAAMLAAMAVSQRLLLLLGFIPGDALIGSALVGLVALILSSGTAAEWRSLRVLRGRTLTSPARAKALLSSKVRRARAANPEAICPIWVGVELPPEAASSHFLVAGATGTGKSTTIRLLMQSVLPSVGAGHGLRAVVYDDKRDFLPFLRQLVGEDKVVSLNPFDAKGAAWHIAADVRDEATAMQVALALIPDDKRESSPYFPEAARSLMAAVMTVFATIAPEKWELRDVMIALSSPRDLELVLNQTAAARKVKEQVLESHSASDVVSTIRTKIAYLCLVAACWHHAERMVSLQDWVEGEGILLLSNDERVRQAVQAANRAILDRLVELLLVQPEPVRGRTWVFLDEMREAGKYDNINSLLLRGRSYKVTVVLGFQAIEGLKALYEDNVTEELVGQCGIRALQALDSYPSREWASRVIDEAEVMEARRSYGRDTTYSEQPTNRRAVMAAEFGQMKRLEQHGVLDAWVLTPFCAPFRQQLDGAELAALQFKAGPSGGYERRPSTDQALGDWTEADHERLGLRPLASLSAQVEASAGPFVEQEEPASEPLVAPADAEQAGESAGLERRPAEIQPQQAAPSERAQKKKRGLRELPP